MPRKLRFVPQHGMLVEVTCRTLQARHLLQPSPEVNELILGVLGRAQRLYGMRICGFVFMSNHYHLLLDVNDAQQMARFMTFLNGNLAKEIGRKVDWREKVWARRYEAILVSPEAGLSRLSYLLSHGVKEGLVEHPREWPGAHCVDALLNGKPLRGLWFNRTLEYRARNRGDDFDPMEFAEVETVEVSPLPEWRGRSRAGFRRQLKAMIERIVGQRRVHRNPRRDRPAVQGFNLGPHHRPARPNRSPAPAFHGLTLASKALLRDAYCLFASSYRTAAEKLQAGFLDVTFPESSFPPPLPFVASRA
ncbi:MAG: transposase [Acidobacteriota bacterium]